MFSYTKILMLFLVAVSLEAKVNELFQPNGLIFDITPEKDGVVSLQDTKPLLVPKEIVLVSTDGKCSNDGNSIQHGNNCYELRCPTGFASDTSGLLCEKSDELCTSQKNDCNYGNLNEETLMCEDDAQECSYKYNRDGFCLVPLVYTPDSVSDEASMERLARLTAEHKISTYVSVEQKTCVGTLLSDGTCVDKNNQVSVSCNQGNLVNGTCKVETSGSGDYCKVKIFYGNYFLWEEWGKPESKDVKLHLYNGVVLSWTYFHIAFDKNCNYGAYDPIYQICDSMKWGVKPGESSTCFFTTIKNISKLTNKTTSAAASSSNTKCPSGYLRDQNNPLKCNKIISYRCPSDTRDINPDDENGDCIKTLYCADSSKHFEMWNGNYRCIKRVERSVICKPGFVYNNRIEKCIQRSEYTCEKL